MQIILKRSLCIVPPAPMNQESWQGEYTPSILHRQDSEIVISTKHGPYLLGSLLARLIII